MTMMLCAALYASHFLTGPWNMKGAPSWLDLTIAGYSLAYDQTHSQALVHDKKSGYYIRREIDCDGAMVSLELTRDRHDVGDGSTENGHLAVPGAVEKPLRRLSTGKGTRIGDSTAALTKRLGKPLMVQRSGARKQFTDYVYVWDTHEKGGTPVQYAETYTFKAGKLIQIVFMRDASADASGDS